MKQINTKKYPIKLVVKTGLHIGGSKDQVQIGALENAVIKDPSGMPYVPGSSLKGKLRGLYELSKGKFGEKGGVHTYSDCTDKINCEICRFFGVGFSSEKKKSEEEEIETLLLGPTRFLFRDLVLDEKSRKKFDELRNKGINPLEEKTEVAINRKTGTALGGALRPIERVPAGTIFVGELVVRNFELDGHEKIVVKDETLFTKSFGADLKILKDLLEADALGGQGSRGSGQVEIYFSEKDYQDTYGEQVAN